MSDPHQNLADKYLLVIKLALLFHSDQPWTSQSQTQWQVLIAKLGFQPSEATSKVLCNVMRYFIDKADKVAESKSGQTEPSYFGLSNAELAS
jgi:hypothetical protein